MTRPETSPLNQTFWVPEYNLEPLRSQLKAVNRKARALGAQEATLTETGEERFEEVASHLLHEIEDASAGEETVNVRFVEVKVEGETPRFPGYVLVASLDHTDDPVIVSTVPGESCPAKYRTTGPVCDHCGYTRRRNKTLVLRQEDGHHVQVGTTCLGDFLGSTAYDPVRWVALAESLWAFLETVPSRGALGGGVGYQSYLDIDDVAFVTAAILRSRPWISKARAQETMEAPTANWVSMWFFPPRNPGKFLLRQYQELVCETSATIQESGEKLHQDVEDALSWALTHEDDQNDYLYNLFAMARSGHVNVKRLGLAVSLLPAYLRHKERLEEAERKKARWASSEHLGQPKQRLDLEGEFLSSRAVGGAGPMDDTLFLLTFDVGGNLVKTFTGRGPGYLGVEEGETYAFRATVKRHGEWKGTKETVVTRLTLKPKEVAK